MDHTPFPHHVRGLLDDPLHVARSAARQGARIIGYWGEDVPVALIIAAGALPLRLRGVAGGATPRADEFLESAFAPELRAVVEQWLTGALDFIDCVVLPRGDDSAQRLYYYLDELRRRGACGGPRPLLYDVANIARPTSAEYTRESTRRLASELRGADSALADSALSNAARRVAERDALLTQIRARRASAAPLPGSLAWRLERVAACDWRVEFDAAARAFLERAPALSAPRRVMLAGDPLPDDTLHLAIERVGGSVVLELNEPVTEDLTARPTLDAIADHFQSRLNPVLAMRANPRWSVELAHSVRADAVVFWLLEENESLPWEISRQIHALESADLPKLLLTRQPWPPPESVRRQVTDFMTTHPETR